MHTYTNLQYPTTTVIAAAKSNASHAAARQVHVAHV
jgi:hypothetical protein